MSEHRYELRRGDGGLGSERMWCATSTCKGFREIVADSSGPFRGIWLFEQMAAHALRHGEVEEVGEARHLTQRWARDRARDPEPVGVVQVDSDHTHAELEALRTELTALRAAPLTGQIDVKANWDIKVPEPPRSYPGGYVLLGAFLSLVGMVASRLLGWL